MEAELIKYAIRLPANQVLQSRIGLIRRRIVGVFDSLHFSTEGVIRRDPR